MFYKCIISSVLTVCIVYWYDDTSVSDKKKLNNIGCIDVGDLDCLYRKTMSTKTLKIVKDDAHPLHDYSILLLRLRMRSIYSKK